MSRNSTFTLSVCNYHEAAILTGLHRTYIGSVERCERNIAIDNMEKIAIALSVSLIDLLSAE
ncbi:MAG: helix-turn-helix transcriptional regulator [Desulfuromusa sp.]|nr:helix-turn-helix transcriptional regulator [Desulfuromusa sp.]